MIVVKYSIMLFSLIAFIYFYLTHITEKTKKYKSSYWSSFKIKM